MYKKINLREIKPGDIITTVVDGRETEKVVLDVRNHIYTKGGKYSFTSSYNKYEPYDAIISFASG